MYASLRCLLPLLVSALICLAVPAGAAAAGLEVAVVKRPDAATQSRGANVAWRVTQAGKSVTGVSVACSIDGRMIAKCASPETFLRLNPGAHRFVVMATKESGKRSLTGSAIVNWTIDYTDPTTPSVVAPSGAWRASPAAIVATGSVDARSGILRYESQLSTDGGVTWFAMEAGASRTVSTQGSSKVRFRSVDRARNASRWDVTDLHIDTTAPAIPTIVAPAGPITGTHMISGTASDAPSGVASLVLRADGPDGVSRTICGLTTALAAWSCAWATDALQPGTYTLRATATDAAGNASSHARSIVVGSAALVIVESAGSSEASEGASDSYTVVLATQPIGPVTVSIGTSAQATAAPSALVFTSSNWSIPQTVTLTAIDDHVDEASPLASVVSHVVSSADQTYAGLANAQLEFSVTDDDASALVVTDTDGSTVVTEAGPGTDIVKVSLASQPTADVIVTPTVTAGNGRVAVSGPLTFTGGASGNWATPQDVTVTAVDDAFDVDIDPGSITLTVTSPAGDALYAALAPVVMSVEVVDDDVIAAAIAIDNPNPVSSMGQSQYRGLSLSKAPASTVTVTASVSGNAGVHVGFVGAGAMTADFTTADWSTARSLAIWGSYTDGVCTAGSFMVLLTASGGGFDGVSDTIEGTFTDADCGAGFVLVGHDDLVVAEAGGTDTFTVQLASNPYGSVDVTFTGNSEVTVVSGGTHQFVMGNWNVPHTVTVAAVDDTDVDPSDLGSIVATSSSTNGSYGSGRIASPHGVAVTDDDAAIVLDTEAHLNSMGQSQYRDVSLAAQPSSTVTVTASVSGNAGVHVGYVGAGTLSADFTTTDWATPQPLAIWGDYTNGVCTDGAFTVLLTASGGGYAGVTKAIEGTFTDADCGAGFVLVGHDDLVVAEAGGTDTFTVQLASNPYGAVDVTFTGNSEVTIVSGGTHQFVMGNWNVPHTVTVAAVNDADVDPSDLGSIVATSSSTNGSYGAGKIASPYAVSVTDDDAAVAPALVVTDPGAPGVHLVRSGPNSETILVHLSRAPSGPVTVTATVGDHAQDATVTAGATLSFDTSNWSADQSVTLTVPSHLMCPAGGGNSNPYFVQLLASGSDFGGVSAVLGGDTTNGTATTPCPNF